MDRRHQRAVQNPERAGPSQRLPRGIAEAGRDRDVPPRCPRPAAGPQHRTASGPDDDFPSARCRQGTVTPEVVSRTWSAMTSGSCSSSATCSTQSRASYASARQARGRAPRAIASWGRPPRECFACRQARSTRGCKEGGGAVPGQRCAAGRAGCPRPAALSCFTPARMTLCTNCRWNSRKPMIRGAEVIRLAAEITDHCTPWSGEANTRSPAASRHARAQKAARSRSTAGGMAHADHEAGRADDRRRAFGRRQQAAEADLPVRLRPPPTSASAMILRAASRASLRLSMGGAPACPSQAAVTSARPSLDGFGHAFGRSKAPRWPGPGRRGGLSRPARRPTWQCRAATSQRFLTRNRGP